MTLSNDQLWPLAEETRFLVKVETELSRIGEELLAEELNKLLQAAGIEIEINFGVNDPAAGSKTARLDEMYKKNFKDGITVERFNSILNNAYNALPKGSLKTEMGNLLNKKLLLSEAQPAVNKGQDKLKM